MKMIIEVSRIYRRSLLIIALLVIAPALVFAEQRILFAENFESGSATGWLFAGKGRNKVTEYEGNHSLNLSRQRNAQMTVDV